MASSMELEEEEEGEELRQPYALRPDWADVSPITVDDGNCVVAVQYTPDHREALSYFRAICESGEKNERALKLTEDMIGFNQADYTAWQYRYIRAYRMCTAAPFSYMHPRTSSCALTGPILAL